MNPKNPGPCVGCQSTTLGRSACPLCGQVFCQRCAERPYLFCCDEGQPLPQQEPKVLEEDGSVDYLATFLLRRSTPGEPAKPEEETANHCIEHQVYVAPGLAVLPRVVTTVGPNVLPNPADHSPRVGWLHSPSLCDKGGCPECETVSDK